jgi:hypothetical protein
VGFSPVIGMAGRLQVSCHLFLLFDFAVNLALLERRWTIGLNRN